MSPSKKKYGKLVRDKIPEIIKRNGETPHYWQLEEKEYIRLLKEKLIEEAEELKRAETYEELLDESADILEVLEAIAKVYDISFKEIQSHKTKKRKERGGFSERVFLEKVE